MTISLHLQITEEEIDLIEFSIRSQINQYSRPQQSDNTEAALDKHTKILELMQLLRKLHQYRNTLQFDLEYSWTPFNTLM